MTTVAPPPWPAPPPPGAPAQPPGPNRPAARGKVAQVELLRGWLGGRAKPPGSGPELGSTAQLAMVSLNILAALLIGLVAQVALVGTLKHNRDQQIAYDDLRLSLAEGTTPVGPIEGKALPKGTPIARITIPAIGLKEVVLEATTAGVLHSGVGHRRDTVLPGQAGISILMGRRMAYGGPFSQLGDLNTGDTIDMITGQGPAQFRVIGVRRVGNPIPGVAAGGSRLTLMTSTGNRFAPKDVLRVDADLTGTAFAAATPFYTAATLPADERPMAKEPGALRNVVGWGVLLLAGAIACVWLRARWGRWQSWLISVPTLSFLGITVADHASRLLPNLL